MIGKTLSTYILVSITIIMLLTIILFFNYTLLASQADKVVYNTLELVSTTGTIDESIYNNMMEDLDKLSRGTTGNRFYVQIKMERRLGENLYDTFIEDSRTIDNDIKESEIVGAPMDIGDRITIAAKDITPTLYGSFMSVSTSFRKGTHNPIGTLAVSASTVISGTSYNQIRGYDVIAEIDKCQVNSNITIKVVTKLNPNGRVYSYASNRYYGDDPSESGNVNTQTGNGIDFIWANGNFSKLEEIEDGHTNLTFIQH